MGSSKRPIVSNPLPCVEGLERLDALQDHRPSSGSAHRVHDRAHHGAPDPQALEPGLHGHVTQLRVRREPGVCGPTLAFEFVPGGGGPIVGRRRRRRRVQPAHAAAPLAGPPPPDRPGPNRPSAQRCVRRDPTAPTRTHP
jgi:hypothetical protein